MTEPAGPAAFDGLRGPKEQRVGELTGFVSLTQTSTWILYALPSSAVRGLAHWRDEVEAADSYTVAMEASKWARLVQKGHGGAIGALLTGKVAGVSPWMRELVGLAGDCVDDRTLAWWTRAAACSKDLRWQELVGEHRSSGAVLDAGTRFERVESWLQGVRGWADGQA